MTNPSIIPHQGARLIWVFAFDGPLAELEAMSPEALAEALGLWAAPDPAAVERFDLTSLADYGFARYLSEASGVAIGDDAARLDALTGVVLLIHSKGLNDQERKFAPEPPFALIGRYGTPPDLTPQIDIDTGSAKGVLPQGKPPKTPARISGMVATVVLIFLAFFVAAFVWVGGR